MGSMVVKQYDLWKECAVDACGGRRRNKRGNSVV